ncbi:MAG: E3 binding domain-containing protein [Trueperaceae bacterium]
MEPDISPLAKRLAEENNVNWRSLLGSGAGGKIVERDVLEYLAKVMAGEEDINPTAEPLPEGMDAWPEEDVHAFYGGAVPEAQTTPGPTSSDYLPDTDFTTVDSLQSDDGLEISSEVQHGDLGEDIFLIDEDTSDLVTYDTATHDTATHDTATHASATHDVQVTQNSVAHISDVDPLEDNSPIANFDEMSSFDDVETEVLSAMGEETPADFASDEDVDDLAALFVEDTVDAPAMPDVHASPNVHASPDVYASSVGLPESIASFNADETTFEVPNYVAEHHDVIEPFTNEPTFEADLLAQSLPDSGSGFVESSFANANVDQGNSVDSYVEPGNYVEPGYVEPASYVEPVVEPVVNLAASETFLAPVHEPILSQEVTPPQPPIAHSQVENAALAALSAPALNRMQAETRSPEAQTLPLVSYGVLLRRHVDLSTLVQAQHAVVEELGQDEPAALTAFLLRAAAKAQYKVSLVPGARLGLAVIRQDGIGVAAIHAASSTPFRNIMNQAHEASSRHGVDAVDLVVADMSNFDIDEAVLNVGVPVLTLGRTMYDSSKGTHHSTLSLSGNVSVESGTKFLSVVAELLNAPVRLVV